jgi:DNA repair photolyase
MKKSTYGYKEWTVSAVNCCTGCSNNCRYCYAKGMASRFGRLTAEEWPIERVRQKDVDRRQRLCAGRIMFPSSHDITPGNFEACMTVLDKLIGAGNEVLIVSKPRYDIIREVCLEFRRDRDKILFRFTIGAMNDGILKFWEPGAPSFEERLDSLTYAFCSKYQTSVSIEPILDSENVIDLILTVEPFVTDAVWIGKMNHIRKNLVIDSAEMEAAVRRIESGQTKERIKVLYAVLRNNPMIKWKGIIKDLLGIEGPDQPGLDI